MIERFYNIRGLVQGVGFRPFVAETCSVLSLGGWVLNSGGSVKLKVFGKEEAVDELVRRLFALKQGNTILPGSWVRSISLTGEDRISNDRPISFEIRESGENSENVRILPADIGLCEGCRRELSDKGNRRFRHPFISCVSCGPRYTIMEKVPYDRENTSMTEFELCEKCKEDYIREGDVRRYAQTICCNDCGPKLYACDTASGKRYSGNEEALDKTIEVLLAGGIAAIKDVGGYHLAHLASSFDAAARLRRFKARAHKAFAVMFLDVDAVEKAAEVSKEERELLTSPERPIVLLRAKHDAFGIAENIAPDSNRIGAMLPCSSALVMILERTGALVMTSANLGGEPIIADDEAMEGIAKASGVIDIVLSNNRRIVSALDDSICQVTPRGVQIIRRARGYVPKPVLVPGKRLPQEAFAAGGDLKASFAIGRGEAVYLSGHFGDLADERAFEARGRALGHMEKLLDIEPKLFAKDAHPSYVSSRNMPDGSKALMHHHAHILSVMAEHGLTENVLGVAYDGTGYGRDGNIWGGEFLLCNGRDFVRAGHIRYAAIMASDISAKDCDISAYGWLSQTKVKDEFFGQIIKSKLDKKDKEAFELRCRAIDKKINTVYSSSMGRLFDTAASILDICHDNEYEGRAPMMLQAAAEDYNGRADAFGDAPAIDIIDDHDGLIADPGELLEWIFNKKREGRAASGLAYLFHRAIADMTAGMCKRIFAECTTKKPDIALSGGTMSNSLLLNMLFDRLEKEEFKVYINKAVPCTDGGIALGQMYYLMEKEKD